MTKVILNGTIQGLRGRIGNLVFRQMPDGTTVMTEAPPKKTRRQKKRDKLRRSPHQKAHNSRFAEASAYARGAQKYTIYKELAAITPMRTAYSFAVQDWFTAPKILRMQNSDGCIRVEATDNILVAMVCVTVLGPDGGVLETGAAVRSEGDWWEFTPQAKGAQVIAEAWDLPGNRTTLTL